MLTLRNSFSTPLPLGKVSFNGFIKALWHVHKEWHGANVSQWAESVMEVSGNKPQGEGAPASQPQSGPRRVHDHPAGPSKLPRSVMDLKAETLFLCFKLMLLLCLPFKKPQTQLREEAWGNGRSPGLESGDLAPSTTVQLTHWQAWLEASLPTLLNKVIGLNISEHFQF